MFRRMLFLGFFGGINRFGIGYDESFSKHTEYFIWLLKGRGWVLIRILFIKLKNVKIMTENQLMRIFEGQQIDFIKYNGDCWITAESIAKGLDLADYRVVQNIFNRHKQVIEPYSLVIKLMTNGPGRSSRIFNRTGTLAIILFSRSPKAIAFQKWVLDVLDEIIHTGSYNPDNATLPSIQLTINQLQKQVESLQSQLYQISIHNSNITPILTNNNNYNSKLRISAENQQILHKIFNRFDNQNFTFSDVCQIPEISKWSYTTQCGIISRWVKKGYLIRVNIGSYCCNNQFKPFFYNS